MFSKWFFRSFLVALALLFLFSGSSFLRLKSWLLPARSSNQEVLALKSQVAFLSGQLSQFSGLAKRFPLFNTRSLPVLVYSTYPFNDKQLLTINAGSDKGILENMPVFSMENIFVGRITRVFSDAALVQTVFDPSLQIPVRIGEAGVDAVVRGGALPYLDLISKAARIVAGESVSVSGTLAPYGAILGMIGKVVNADGASFQRAALTLPYTLSDLHELLVVTNYVPSR